MPALLFSAGSNAVLESVHGSVFNDHVSRRLVFRWIAPLPEPVDSFKFVHGEDIVFSNDFVACKDVHDFKPKPVSVLLDPNLATPQLLAFSTRRHGKNKQSRAQRKRKAKAVSNANTGSATNSNSIPGARAGLAWDDSVLRQKGKRVVISCEVPGESNTP
jgi:hypothetical protein